MKPRILFNQLDTLLAHVSERFIEFHIVYNHAKIHHQREIDELVKINKEIISALYGINFSDEDIKKLKATSEFWDSVQSNFSYDRTLNSELLSKDEQEKHTQLIPFIVNYKSNPEFINKINGILANFPHRFWLRIADIVSVVTPEHFLEKVNALNEFQRIQRSIRTDYDTQSISVAFDKSNTELAPVSDALSFYPEKIRPGIFYIYPENDEIKHFSNLAITCHYGANKDDIQEVLEGYEYQFEKFRNYYHMNSNDFVESPEIEKLRPLLTRSLNKNKHIKRTTSIEDHILALICWENINLNGIETKKAISSLLPKGYDSNDFASLKEKLKHISKAMVAWDKYYSEMNEL
ncbi:hypothetical protein ACW5W8_20550 [Aeromonas aquatilis]